jgi:cell shape-determining protein MreC
MTETTGPVTLMFDEQRFREAVLDTYYEAYYQELMCDFLGSRWSTIDVVASFVVAITASGSAVTGLAFWSTPEGKVYWAAIAIASSVIALAHGVLHVAEKVKVWGDLRRTFIELRVKLETLIQDLAIEHSLENQKKKFDTLRDQYNRLIADAPSDFIATNGARARVQDSLDKLLAKRGLIR